MRLTKRQLRRIIKEALGDRGDLPKKRQSKIGMQGPEDLPYGDVTSSKKALQSAKPMYDPDVQQWQEWAEGYGLQEEEDNEGQLIFYFDINDDVDGTIVNEAEIMGGDVQSTGSYDGNMIIYTGVYSSEVDLGPYIQ